MRAALLLAGLLISNSYRTDLDAKFCAVTLLVFFTMDVFELMTIYAGVLK